jgi:hypothetical protein
MERSNLLLSPGPFSVVSTRMSPKTPEEVRAVCTCAHHVASRDSAGSGAAWLCGKGSSHTGYG